MTAPKLRFKEFDEDWTAKKLSQVANLTSSKRVHLSDYVSEGIPFFRGKEITELKSGIFPKDILYISKKQYEDFKEKFGAPQNNEILMTAVGTLANTYLINTDFEFYFKDGNLIWFKDINADPNFLMILLDARKNDVLASAIGSTQKALTIANLNKLIFNFPSKEEQTKIASFLSVVDEKISQLTQKHELLSQYKQGMMQKLFSQQLRFKADDGSEFGEWEETTLDNFLTESLVKGNKGDEARKLTVKLWGKGVIPKNEAFQGSENTQYYRRSAGQLIYGKLDFLNCAFGIIPQHLDGFESTIDAPAFNIDQSVANPYFLLNRFFQKDFYKKNGEEADGSRKAKRINQSVFLAMTIQLPCIQEQTKIANFLSAIDQKIEVVTQQIEQAKHWKKGLLQQMFV